MTSLDTRVRLEIYRSFLAGGRPPTVAEAAERLAEDETQVARAYARLARERAIVLAPGTQYVWMAAPLSATPTAFPVETEHGLRYGNCIWDALGIPAMLGADARVATACADCGEPLEIRVEDGRLEGDGFVAHFAVPAARWWDDIAFT